MQKFVIAFYIRLSLEDTKTESMSIPNQRAILREHAMSLAEWDRAEVLEFVDNGHSGANFERPAVQELFGNGSGRKDRLYHGERPFPLWP